MGDEITADHSLDARLDRRLKRRMVANQQYRNSCRRTVKKTAQEEDSDLVDEEYRKFLSSSLEFVDDSDANVDAKFVDFGHRNNNNGASWCKWSEGDVDPVYKMFFQHLIKNGKSYKLEIPSDNGMKLFVKYEEEEQLSDGLESSLKNDGKRLKTETTRILRSASRIEKLESPEKSCEDFGHEKKPLEGLNESSRGIEEAPISGSRVSLTGTSLLRSIKRPSRSDSESDMIDEDYKIFLTDFLYDDDHRLLYTPVDGRSIVYENDESTSDSEVVMMDTDPFKPGRASFGRKSFHTAMDVDSGKCLQSPGMCRSSNFRERLMKVLKRPYDQDEYKFFLEEASFCRAHLRYRELRNGVLKAYPVGSFAKSYLDLYGELAMKIKSVSYDRPRILNLLRGFFYWLQNLSHEDAFQPWIDPSCLNVLPQS